MFSPLHDNTRWNLSHTDYLHTRVPQCDLDSEPVLYSLNKRCKQQSNVTFYMHNKQRFVNDGVRQE